MTENQPLQAPVYIQAPPRVSKDDDRVHFAKTFPRIPVLIMSYLQVIAFVICTVTQIIMFNIRSPRLTKADFGTGIWTGFVFGIAGSIGLMAANRPTHCMIVALMVMSIFASLMSLPLITFSGYVIGEPFSYESQVNGDWNDANTTMASFQLFTGIMEGVVAIVSAVFCCRAVCCGRQTNTGMSDMSNTQSGATTAPAPMQPTFGCHGTIASKDCLYCAGLSAIFCCFARRTNTEMDMFNTQIRATIGVPNADIGSYTAIPIEVPNGTFTDIQMSGAMIHNTQPILNTQPNPTFGVQLQGSYNGISGGMNINTQQAPVEVPKPTFDSPPKYKACSPSAPFAEEGNKCP